MFSVGSKLYHSSTVSQEYYQNMIRFIERTVVEITIPDDVTKLGPSAFAGCADLKSVVFGRNITAVGGVRFSIFRGLRMLL